MRPDRSPLLIVIAVLLALNAWVTLVGRGGPAAEVRVIPAAQAQDHGPLQADLRTGKTLVTSSPDGSTLYVWYCEIVNGNPTFRGTRYAAGN